MQTTLVNLTAAAVTIEDAIAEVFPTLGHARVECAEFAESDSFDTPTAYVTIFTLIPGESRVVGLPAPTEGIIYLVESEVRNHPSSNGRSDLFCPVYHEGACIGIY